MKEHVTEKEDIDHPVHYMKIWYYDLVYSKEKNHVQPQNKQWSDLMQKSYGVWRYAASYKGDNTEMLTAKLFLMLEGEHLESFVRYVVFL